jgi:HPt (histidine-containing phosphotransfer) domain-containing protein
MAIDEVQALQMLAGNRHLLRELAAIFAEDSVLLVNAFDQAVEEQDATEALQTIHSLKGITATFFAEPEVKLFATVETAAAHSDWSRLELARKEISEAVTSIVREMHEKSWLSDASFCPKV